MRLRHDCLVQVAMRLGWGDVETDDLLCGDFDVSLVGVLVQPVLDIERGLRGGVGNQLDVDLIGQHARAPPVLGGEREQAVFDAVPFLSGGKCATVIDNPIRSAKVCSSVFHSRTRALLLPL